MIIVSDESDLSTIKYNISTLTLIDLRELHSMSHLTDVPHFPSTCWDLWTLMGLSSDLWCSRLWGRDFPSLAPGRVVSRRRLLVSFSSLVDNRPRLTDINGGDTTCSASSTYSFSFEALARSFRFRSDTSRQVAGRLSEKRMPARLVYGLA